AHERVDEISQQTNAERPLIGALIECHAKLWVRAIELLIDEICLLRWEPRRRDACQVGGGRRQRCQRSAIEEALVDIGVNLAYLGAGIRRQRTAPLLLKRAACKVVVDANDCCQRQESSQQDEQRQPHRERQSAGVLAPPRWFPSHNNPSFRRCRVTMMKLILYPLLRSHSARSWKNSPR